MEVLFHYGKFVASKISHSCKFQSWIARVVNCSSRLKSVIQYTAECIQVDGTHFGGGAKGYYEKR